MVIWFFALLHLTFVIGLPLSSSCRRLRGPRTGNWLMASEISPSGSSIGNLNLAATSDEIGETDAWESALVLSSGPYVSPLLDDCDSLQDFVESLDENSSPSANPSPLPSGQGLDAAYALEPGRAERIRRRRALDPLWEQIKLEATAAVRDEPAAGPLFFSVLAAPSLLDCLITIIANEVQTELIPATELRNLFLDQLTSHDDSLIHLDIMAAAMRSPNSVTALQAVLFNKGLHALVCYRVGHRLWNADRRGLAKYLQATISSKYSADIHPNCKIGGGTFLSSGVVIGETAIVGEDVSILQGVTLGGTGKDAGDRHPKVGNGVVLHGGATVLGNICVGDGSIITAKSIVTKPVPPLARVSGVPAKVKSYRILPEQDVRDLSESCPTDESLSLLRQYMNQWQKRTLLD